MMVIYRHSLTHIPPYIPMVVSWSSDRNNLFVCFNIIIIIISFLGREEKVGVNRKKMQTVFIDVSI